MEPSATEPQSEQDWDSSLFVSDLDGTEGDIDDEGSIDVDEGTATDSEGSPPEETEGEDLAPAEGDAEAETEGPDAAEGEEAADAAEGDEPGEAEPTADAEAEAAPDAAEGDDRASPDEPGQDWDWKPVTLRADKAELDIPGVLHAEGQGLWIPAESIPKLQSSLADRGVWERERQIRDTRIRELEAHVSDAEKAAEAAVAWFGDDNGFWALTDDEKWAWLQDQQKNQPLIQAQMQSAREKSRADRLEQQQRVRDDAERQAAEGRYRERAFATETARAITLSQVKDLGIDVETVRTRLRSLEARGEPVFFRATKEFVERHPNWGLAEGELTINYTLLADVVDQEARVIRAGKAAAQTVQQAKQINQSKERGAKPKKAAPAIRAGSTPAPSGRKERSEPTSLADWEASLND